MRTAVLAVRLGELAGASAEELVGHLLRRAAARLRLHLERARGGAAVRRRHRAPGRLLPRRPHQPRRGARVLPLQRRARPAPGGALEDGRGGDRRAPLRGPARRSRRCARSRSGSPAGSACARASRTALEYVFARWDGLGFPAVAGEEIPLPMRLLHVARDASLFMSAARPRARPAACSSSAPARAYEPRARRARRARTSTRCSPSWTRRRCGSTRSTCEPSPLIWLSGERIDAAFATIAAITGLKSPWLREHSTAVAELAEAAAWRMGLARRVRHASCGVPRSRTTSAASACRTRSGRSPGRSRFGEWERVRLHAHYTERAFAQSPALAPVGQLAGSHHERLDGSGYHRGARGRTLDLRRPHPRRRRLLRRRCARRGPHRPALDAGGGGGRASARGAGGPARRRRRRRRARGGRPPRREAPARAAGGAHAARARGAARARARASRTRRSATTSGSRRRPSGTTSSTSTRRPACAAARRRRSGPSSRSSFTAGIGRSPDAAPGGRAQILASTSAPNARRRDSRGGNR